MKIEHGGQNMFEFDAEPAENELTLINNKAVAALEGVRDRLKVLLVSGEPNPGERAWRNLLKSDAECRAGAFHHLRPPEKQDGTPIRELSLIAFPTAELFGAKIKDFDLIVFDRYSNAGLLPPAYFDNIVRYVRERRRHADRRRPRIRQTGQHLLHADRQGHSRLSQRRRAGAALSPEGDEGCRPSPGLARSAWSDAQPPDSSECFRLIDAELLRGANILSGPDGTPVADALARAGRGASACC